jgi:addiction module HigA family antidote
MIRSFRDGDTERLAAREQVKQWSPELSKAALRKLRMLDAAEELSDLRVPPGDRLERLQGDQHGQHSIRRNDQWRICLRWEAGNADDVEIVDCHEEVGMTTKLPSVHPGEVLLEEFLEPMGLSQYRLAKDVSVPPRRSNEIVHGQRAVTADTALRLARYFATTPRFWLNLQAHYELDIEADRLGDRLDREVTAHTS